MVAKMSLASLPGTLIINLQQPIANKLENPYFCLPASGCQMFADSLGPCDFNLTNFKIADKLT